MYTYSTKISPIMITNRIYENQNLLSLWLVSFLLGLRTYQQPCRGMGGTESRSRRLVEARKIPPSATSLPRLGYPRYVYL